MKTLTACTLLATCLVACGGEPGQAAQARLPPSASAPGWPDLGRGNSRYIRFDIGPDTLAECQRFSPTFPFDSAVTYAQDRAQLGALAACLNSPGMTERKIQLVGRADPQGTEAYNDRLAMQRARAIEQILLDNGIARQRIELASEGSRSALGYQPEYSPGYDRRVDVIVIGGRHSP